MFHVSCVVKVNKYARERQVLLSKSKLIFCTIKTLFFWMIWHREIRNHCDLFISGKWLHLGQYYHWCRSYFLAYQYNGKFKGRKFQTSTVNVFGCQNSQFELPQNFISQNDRGRIAVSLEYYFHSLSYVPGWEFCR